jgi:hypothetical protein
MIAPRVLAEPPAGWRPTDRVVRPRIAESAGARLLDWEATEPAGKSAAFVRGCVATPIPGWVDDMAPAVEARGVALAGAVAEGITGRPMDARAEPAPHLFALRAASHLAGPVLGHARTFLGFDDSRVFTCFAVCAREVAEAEAPACEASATEARLEGSAPPPSPGLGLRTATWAVHHPRPAALGAGLLVIGCSILAIALRRRPRSAIHRRG